MARPALVVFDVNETLSDLTPLAARLEEVGAPGWLLGSWFTAVLRDGFALTVVDAFADFRALALANLTTVLQRLDDPPADVEGAAEHVVAGFVQLDAHPDVPAGMHRLHEAGVTLATMTNGSVAITDALLDRAGLTALVTHRLDVTAVRRWKPACEPYLHALDVAGAEPAEAALVAVHPWDVDGAQRAGLTGAWLNRHGDRWPPPFQSPHLEGRDLTALAGALLAA